MRILIGFLLFFFLSYPGTSQHVLLGPKVGIQASKAFFDDEVYGDSYNSLITPTYHVGIVANFKVTDLFSLQTEVLYNQTTKKVKGKEFYLLNTERYQLITVPLLLRTTFKSGFNQYYFNVGPNLSYWIGGSGKIRTDELYDHGLQELSYKLKFGNSASTLDVYYVEKPNHFLLGLDIGAGVMLPVRDKYLMLDLRYTWGHTNLQNAGINYMGFLNYESNLAHANHVLSFSVAYLFEFDFLTMMTKGKSTSKGEK